MYVTNDTTVLKVVHGLNLPNTTTREVKHVRNMEIEDGTLEWSSDRF